MLEWHPGCSRWLVTSLLLKFGRLLLGFQGVYERLDAAFHAAGHSAGHGVRGWRRGGAGALGGRPCHQTLLIPQLRKEKKQKTDQLKKTCWFFVFYLFIFLKARPADQENETLHRCLCKLASVAPGWPSISSSGSHLCLDSPHRLFARPRTRCRRLDRTRTRDTGNAGSPCP